MIEETNAETRKEYEEIKARISDNTAKAQDYVSIIDYSDLVNEKISEDQKQDYLRKAYSAAQSELLSSSDDERESAYLTLAQYYDKLKDYPNALKNYDNAVKLNSGNIVLRARFRALSMNDKKGAKKDYELAKSMGLSEQELKLFDLLVNDAGAIREKTQVFLIYFYILLFIIAIGVYVYIKYFL